MMSTQTARNDLGAWGERQAEDYLESEGWEILDRNWRAARGEVDLIVTRELPGYAPGSVRRVVAFVEVKTRVASRASNPPECSVTYRKRQQIVKLAKCWQQSCACAGEVSVRFDVIGILASATPRCVLELRHLEGAFDAMGRC